MVLYAFDGIWNKHEEDPKGDTNIVKFLEAFDKGAKNKVNSAVGSNASASYFLPRLVKLLILSD